MSLSTPPSTDHSPGARTRAVLTREAIVAAGVELVAADGPDALTMRAVAGRLGSGVMSLYRHVADREALLDLVLDAMAGEIPATPLTGQWRTDAAALARDVRSVLVQRPQLTVLLTSRMDRAAGGLAALDRGLAIFRSAGLSPRDAVEANHALGNFVAGAALWDALGLGGTSGEERRARRESAVAAIEALPAGAFPNVTWAGGALFSGSPDERFETGLAMLLEGISRRAEQSVANKPAEPTRPRRTEVSGVEASLREALAVALRGRDTAVAAALRAALAALANAEAVPAVEAGPALSGGSQHVAGAAAGLGAAEVPRRTLTERERRAVVAVEVAELEAHAVRLGRLGRDEDADDARRGRDALAAVLAGSRLA